MLTLPRSAAAFICMMTITLLTVTGCSNGNDPAAGALTAPIGPPGYQMEAVAGPGKEAAAFRSDYAACERSEGKSAENPYFFAACMQLAGNAVHLHNGVVLGPKKQERQEFQASSCRNFSTNFTDRNEAFTQCMSSLGNSVTRPDGTVIPPRAKFATQLVLVPEAAPPAAAPAKVAETAPPSQSSAADNQAAVDLLRVFLNAVRIAGVSRKASSSASTGTTSSHTTSDDPNPFGSMIGNYASCGDMWGCWAH